MNKKSFLSKQLIYLIFMLTILGILTVFALSIGLSEVNFLYILNNFSKIISAQNLPEEIGIILYEIRLPRVLLAILVGAGLSLAGTGTQAVLCNPLVSPTILGLSAGAAFGASVCILYGGSYYNQYGEILLVLCAFSGGIIATAISYFISTIKNNSKETVILAGVAIGYIFSGITILLQYLAPFQDLRSIVFWTVGSLWNANMETVYILFPIVIIGGILFYALSTALDNLLLGEENAFAVGVSVAKLRIFSLFISTILCASIIAFTGAIGFIGLICPHITRMLFGNNHRWLIPCSMLMGAILLLFSDTVSRFIMWPQELPVGVITAMIGGPFFLYQLINRKKDWWS